MTISNILKSNGSAKFTIIGCLAIGWLILYWFGWALLVAILWLTVFAALAMAVGAGYLAYRAQNKNQLTFRLGLCGAGLMFACGVGWAIPKNTNAALATWTYWMELSRIHRVGSDFNRSSQAARPAATIETLAVAAKKCNEMAEEIRQLPTTGVDSRVVDFAAEQVQLLNECAFLMVDLRALLEQDRELGSASTAARVFVVSFVRGMFGDPFGGAKDLINASEQLNGKGRQIGARLDSIRDRQAKFASQEVRLRANLSRDYGREFPLLDR